MAEEGLITVLVVVAAKAGKETRVRELVEWVAGEVKKEEQNVKYYAANSVDGDEEGTTDFYIFFRIHGEGELKKRSELPHHQTIAKAIKEEDLLREPLRYRTMMPVEQWSR